LRGAHAVIHLAARAHVLDETSDALLEVYRATNRDLTLALARAAGAAGVRRFVFVSSIRVNGSFTTRPFRPTDPPAPDEPYAISKHEAELGLQAIARATGLEVVIVRPPLVYGPGVKANFLRLLRLASTGVPLPLGSISGKRSLVSIWNLCDLLVRCAGLPAAANRTFLAGDGEDVTLPALIRTLAAGMKRPCRVFPAPPRLVRLLAVAFGQGATFDKLTASLQVDVSETRRVLDWTPPVPLAQGLARTAEWYTRAVLHRGAQAPA
jgi:UDP-glucose 4-epimerase